MRGSLTKDYHINLGILRNNLYQYKNILKNGGNSNSVNAEIDLRRRMKAQGRSLIEFLMREHMLRDHGTELNQDNFDGIARDNNAETGFQQSFYHDFFSVFSKP